MSSLDVFQLKGLRKILKITSTYVNRSHTKEYVYNRARQELGDEGDPLMQPLSAYHKERRVLMMAKVITLRSSDPGARATFEPETLNPHGYGTRLVGHPRLNWVQCAMQDTWEVAKATFTDYRWAGELNLNNPVHRNLLLQYAETVN